MSIIKNAIITFIFLFVIFFGAALLSESPKDFLLLPFVWIYFFILFAIINIFLVPYQKALSRTGVLKNLAAISKMPKEEYENRRKLFLRKNNWMVGGIIIVVFIVLLGLGYTFVTRNIGGLWIVFISTSALIPLVIKFLRGVMKEGE